MDGLVSVNGLDADLLTALAKCLLADANASTEVWLRSWPACQVEERAARQPDNNNASSPGGGGP